jgi:tocopherol O-methyltransferase
MGGNGRLRCGWIRGSQPEGEAPWALCAGRVAKKLLTHSHYRRYLLDARSKNRIFALSLPRIWLAYATGSMRYGLLTAHKPSSPA